MNADPCREPHARPSTSAPGSLLLLDVARAALTRHGGDRWVVRPTEAWCYLTPPDEVPRRHGWKLHVSATPLSAPIVLARSAEVLIRNGCSFKFAPDLARVTQLVDAWYNRGSGGKFITAYPRDDEHFRVLANQLHEVTEGLVGPRILSDKQLRPGSLVHSRYGTFNGEQRFTDDGLFVSHMVGPDGSTVNDVRNAWFSPPAWAVYPFPDEPAQAAVAPESVLLGGRFRVRRAIRYANKGGVYRATDELDGAEVIVKQARPHVAARLDGTDVRDRLRQEARMLDLLASTRLTPAKVALFEEQNDLFLVEQAIPGDPLAAVALQRNGALPAGRLTGLARTLVRLVETVHQAGFVINDLKPQNVMVTPADQVVLVDVEHVSERGKSWAPAFTEFFCAPEVVRAAGRGGASLVPEPSADCFSLGVTIFCMATALPPTWVSGHAGAERSRAERESLLSHISRAHPELEPFVELIVGLTETDPTQRWSLERAHDHLVASPPSGHRASVAGPMRSTSLDRLVRDGMTHLQRTMAPRTGSLWKTAPQPRGDVDPGNAWNGAAGGLRVLTRAYAARNDESLRSSLVEATTWVDERRFAVPRLLPGLAYGRSGTAWALFEAATLLGDDGIAAHAVELAKRLPLAGPSPDITHGLSGAGLAHLHLWAASGDEELRQRALTYADAVLAAARRDGDDKWCWPTSPEADSLVAGVNVYGYAHGVAGVGAFLMAAAQAVGADDEHALRDRYLEAARAAADTLVTAAVATDREISWPSAIGSDELSGAGGGQWCNGPTGIGGFLIRAWAATNEQRYADLAMQCAATVVRQSWVYAAGACCGLAGVGHFLLDLADITGQAEFRTDAEHVAAILQSQGYVVDGLMIAGDHDTGLDYAIGVAGVLDFLIRLHDGGSNPWTPSLRLPAPA